jgi:hypothetical protein
MRFFKGLMCMTCLVLWVVFLAVNGHLAGWKGAGIYLMGTIFYAGFCMLMKDEEDDDGDNVQRPQK